MQPACSQAGTRTGSSGWVDGADSQGSPQSNTSSADANGEEVLSSNSNTPKGSFARQGKHSRSATPTPSWKSHSYADDWQARTYVRGMVRSKSCCEGQVGDDCPGAGTRVRWGSNPASSCSGFGGRDSCSWGDLDFGLRRAPGGHKPRHVRRNSADSGSSWKHSGRTAFGGDVRRKWRPQKSPGRLGSWDDCLSREDVMVGEKFLWEEASRKLALKSSVFMPKIECKLEELPQMSNSGQLLGPGLDGTGGRRIPRKPSNSRNRTSKFIGVGASNRKNQWQARILIHGKVTHLGYYRSEEEAAMIYDRVAISLNAGAATNFPPSHYKRGGDAEFAGLSREELQRALGVKPMDKSSIYKGVSRKKGKWEAKVMVNRKWAYRALFDSETEAARAYDAAVWRLKPKEASSFVNFKSEGLGRKRGNDPASSLVRAKSQRRETPAFADLGPLDSQGGNALTLDLAHIPQLPLQRDLEAGEAMGNLLEAPATPARCHSEQHLALAGMGTPLGEGSAHGGLPRPASSYTLPEVMHDFQNGTLEMFTLPAVGDHGSQMAGQMLNVSQPYAGPPTFTSLPAIPLAGTTMLNLPDPNSIGVPPPDNLPFPELVKQPLATASSVAEGLPSRLSSGSVQHLMAMDGPALGLSSRRPSMASIPSSLPEIPAPLLSTGLPEIPPPLLPTIGLLNQEGIGLGMEGCWVGISQGQALLSNLQLRSQTSSPHPQQNPFEEASTLLPHSTAQPLTPMARVVMENGQLFGTRPAMLQKLKSMPEGAYAGLPHGQNLQALPTLPSAGCVLPRRASEVTLSNSHHYSQSLELDIGAGGMMMGGYSGQFAHAPCLQRQPSIPDMLAGGVPLMSSVGTPLDFSHLQMPKSVFQPSQAPSEGQCHGGSSYAGIDPLPPSLQNHSSVASGRTCLPEMNSSLRSGHLPRSLSTSSLLHPMQGQHGSSGLQLGSGGLQHCGSSLHPGSGGLQLGSGGLQLGSGGLHPGNIGLLHGSVGVHHSSGGLQSVCQPQQSAMEVATHRGLGECSMDMEMSTSQPMETDENQPICPDATDILAELGVNTRAPDQQLDFQSVQIGGDSLHTYDSMEMAVDSYLLGCNL